ncbi:hypothetical protein MLD38_009259 [Melastoma candidum]|uniref:Uncharacterized protein n=1 Tax=Melastoma candidum TaxID=119954 RepID=A0ACB9S012_9MYRT|nr:hypothetical protein MLD38_009259 [Melastoma candidum]
MVWMHNQSHRMWKSGKEVSTQDPSNNGIKRTKESRQGTGRKEKNPGRGRTSEALLGSGESDGGPPTWEPSVFDSRLEMRCMHMVDWECISKAADKK